ncbi:TPA: DNA-directed RNA polymerase subunit H [Candidatus Woesearchaeota archaeon]|nr:DNA-directed RNA polymerase subunit H [Candidatus Woesearchaeota archaeon]
MAKEAIKHALIPKHTKLSDKEKEKVLEEYQITVNELPSILLSDAALRGLDAQEGDVIKIERESPTAGTATFYRGVING